LREPADVYGSFSVACSNKNPQLRTDEREINISFEMISKEAVFAKESTMSKFFSGNQGIIQLPDTNSTRSPSQRRPKIFTSYILFDIRDHSGVQILQGTKLSVIG
jgi:hypothetical protein